MTWIAHANPNTLKEEKKEKSKHENRKIANGVPEALFAFFNVILEPGDEVIVEFPGFQTLYELPKALDGFLPEPGKIRELITPKQS